MFGALVVVALALAGVFYGSSEKDGKKRSVGIATISAIIGAIAVLIAFPNLLSIGGELSIVALGLTAAVGVILLMASGSKKFPTGIGLILGATLVAWALFRWLPTGPAAFQFLGEHATTAGNALWDGITGFAKILGGSPPLKKK